MHCFPRVSRNIEKLPHEMSSFQLTLKNGFSLISRNICSKLNLIETKYHIIITVIREIQQHSQ